MVAGYPFLLVIFIIAGVIIAFGVRLYNKRLNAVAKGEKHGTHTSIPEPRSLIIGLYLVILMGILIAAFIKIDALNDKISGLQSSLAQTEIAQENCKAQLEFCTSQVSSILSLVADDNRLMVDESCGIVGKNYSDAIVEYQYRVVLKNYDDNTEAVLKVDDSEIRLHPQGNGAFSGNFYMEWFTKVENAELYVYYNGVTRKEKAAVPEYAFTELLPIPRLEAKIEATETDGNMTYEGWYSVELSALDVSSVTAYYLSDGKEVGKVDITEDAINNTVHEFESDISVQKGLTLKIVVQSTSDYEIIVTQNVLTPNAAGAETDLTCRYEIVDENGATVWSGQLSDLY